MFREAITENRQSVRNSILICLSLSAIILLSACTNNPERDNAASQSPDLVSTSGDSTLASARGAQTGVDPDSRPAMSTQDEIVLQAIKDRLVENTFFLRSTLSIALQEDGTGEELWRMMTYEDKVLYDISNGIPYIQSEDKQEELLGIIFPQQLKRIAYGWEDENGFKYRQVLEQDGKRYISIMEIAEKNGAFAFLQNGYGDVSYFSEPLLKFMKENYYPNAAFAGEAWRKIYLEKNEK